jgi:mono/diheme cytochrome c family protein
MRITLYLALGVLIGGVLGCTSMQQGAQHRETLARGHAAVEAHCSSCHAVDAQGQSPAPEAPPFRLLSRTYRVATLEDALTKGISTGHPAMPEIQLQQVDVEAVVAYLQSIQAPRPQ